MVDYIKKPGVTFSPDSTTRQRMAQRGLPETEFEERVMLDRYRVQCECGLHGIDELFLDMYHQGPERPPAVHGWTMSSARAADPPSAIATDGSAESKNRLSGGTIGSVLRDNKLKDAETGNLQEVRNALSAGVDINAKGEYGVTALMVAAARGDQDIVQALLEAGAEVDARNENDLTSLGAAALDGHAAVVKILLAAGADTNVADKEGITPLMAAALGGHIDAAKELLTAGANITAETHGITALGLARRQGHAATIALLESYGAQSQEPRASVRGDKWDIQIGDQARVGASLAGVGFKGGSITHVALIAPPGVAPRPNGTLKGRINGQSFALPSKAGECTGFQNGIWIVSQPTFITRDDRRTGAIFMGFISKHGQPPRVEITEADV